MNTAYHTPHTAHHTPHTAYRTPQTTHRILILFLLLLGSVAVHAQRFEVHAIKDLSTDKNAHKAWGVGGTIELDQLVKKVTFKAYFDWAMYKDKNSDTHSNYQRMGGGIVACYSINVSDKFTFQCGAEVNFMHLKHSYIHTYYEIDSVMSKPITVLQRGSFIGIGPHIGLLYKLTPRFSVALNVVPTYLISVGRKSSIGTVEPEYNKNIWLFPIRLGFSYQLFK
jgi:hypothetical protein